MCSPTRIAFAMAVNAGFTAPMLGKKLVSTTYRLSSSWALQLTSSTDVAGSVPNRQVPAWWAQPGNRDAHVHVEVLAQHVVLGHPAMVEDLLQLLIQPVGLGVVGRGVGQVDVAVSVGGDPVVRLGKVLGGEPEVHRVPGDIRQRPFRREHGEFRLLAAHGLRVGLADHLDVAHRPLVVFGGEVEVVDPQGLLKDRVVRLLRQRHHRLAVVEHVVASHLVRAVRQPPRVGLGGRVEQDLGAVRGTGADRHDVGAVRSPVTVAGDDNSGDAAPGGVGLQPGHLGPRQQRDVVPAEHRPDRDHLGIRLRVHQTGITVTPRAADTGAAGPVGFVELDAAGAWNGFQPPLARPSAICWIRSSCDTAGHG